jgi:hypothetical protein
MALESARRICSQIGPWPSSVGGAGLSFKTFAFNL